MPSPRRNRSPIAKPIKWLLGFSLGCCLAWGIYLGVTLQAAAARPVDGILVLGGSIRREMYAAQLLKQLPPMPIVISGGSPPPCVKLIFQREQTATAQVWLEECAKSTFANFYYSLPILQRSGVHKVKLITSATHTGRALTMARIILGSHGIWVEPDFAIEQGRPGNKESIGKTVLDIGRSLGWAVGSQFYQPHCGQVMALNDVDLDVWRKRQFTCEHQGHLKIP
jgi:DUF218 domain